MNSSPPVSPQKQLSFTTDPKTACANADVLWLCYDTPVNENDESDVESVLAQSPPRPAISAAGRARVDFRATARRHLCQARKGISRGFILPIRLKIFASARRSTPSKRLNALLLAFAMKPKSRVLEKLFAPFTPQILFMRTESAEMVKHALNSFLALSITFINEVARLGEHVGADAKEVSAGLKSEPRIGPKAYLGPGGPFAGGTLARDVVTLTKLAEANGEKISVIPAIKQSNDLHRGWAFRRLQSRLGDLHGKNIAVLGLTYTTNTDTLRRSAAVELCRQLLDAGAKVSAFDPAVKNACRPELSAVSLAADIPAAVGRCGSGRCLHRMAAVPAGGLGKNCSADAPAGFCGCQPFFGKGIEKPARSRTSFRWTRLNMKLKGINTLITGGSQGLGKAIAGHFLAEGANVVLCARSEKDLSATRDELAKQFPSQKVCARTCDVADETQTNELVAFALRELGSLHVLVLNAGIYGPMGATESVSLDEWRRAMDINVYGVLLPSRAVIPHFKKNGRGKIIVLSGGGATNPLPNISAYAASKAAAVRLMETLAEELKTFHVDVNAIAPGALATRLVDEVLAAGPEKGWRRLLRKEQTVEGKRRDAARIRGPAGGLSGQPRKRRDFRQAHQRAMGSVGKTS